MRVAVMQPYFFPYIGYYQLVQSVDEFIFLDDVNFIKKGFVNRNTLLNHGEKLDFTLPIHKSSQNKLIKDLDYINSFEEFMKKLNFSYSKAPFKKIITEIINDVFSSDKKKVSEINARSVEIVFSYLGISKKFSFSSQIEESRELKSNQKIIEICKYKGANSYHNAIGGKNLYEHGFFSKNEIDLKFIKSQSLFYQQGERKSPFIENLSMIDMLMWIPPEKISEHLNNYALID